MSPLRLDSTQTPPNRWSSEGWTGEHDSAAAIALAASLVLGAFLLLILAAMELR